VWDSLIAGLRKLGQLHEIQPAGFVQYLKDRNRKLSASEYTVNGTPPKPSELEECFEWIRNMVFSYDGYYCSPHDPLIIWVVCLFKVAIEHTFLGHTHRIAPRVATAGTIFLNSTRGHMSLVRTSPPGGSVAHDQRSAPEFGVQLQSKSSQVHAGSLRLSVRPTSNVPKPPASVQAHPHVASTVELRKSRSGSTATRGIHVRIQNAGPRDRLSGVKGTEVRSLDQLREVIGRRRAGDECAPSITDRIGLR
jgi:hypothetical protein